MPHSPPLPRADLRRKWFVEASQCNADEGSSVDGGSRLAVSQVWSVFLLLGIGAAVALLVTLGEVLYYSKVFAGECRIGMPLLSLSEFCDSQCRCCCRCRAYGGCVGRSREIARRWRCPPLNGDEKRGGHIDVAETAQ